LGIDLGTTRTVVAVADRGNFPVVGFSTDGGDLVEHVPTVTADVGGELVHGHEAERAALGGAPHLRSWKRLLSRQGPEERIWIGSVETTLIDLCTDFCRHLGEALLEGSNMPPASELPEAVISVPANAHSGQRFTTLEAFRRAGFRVVAMINEPSAAAIEYAHRYRNKLNTRRDHVVVYDLGGGTFDAALVTVAGGDHDVIDTAGIQELGGDDFDAVLLEMALDAGGVPMDVARPVLGALLDECRAAKESLGPNTRRLALDLGALGTAAPKEPLVIDVGAYYDRLRPYVEHTMRALAEVMSAGGHALPEASSESHEPDDPSLESLEEKAAEAGVAGVYVVGGASGLPVVPRILRERFKHRVQRSVYPSASTAIGLAIAADDERAPRLNERFTRHLGVFRETGAGATIVFDSIFSRGTPMPPRDGPPLVERRTYRAAHNVGHFRFVECGALGDDREPRGDISPHGTVYFPFARELRGASIEGAPIVRLDGPGPLIEERYEVVEGGVIAVTISDLDDGFSQRFVLG
jgi:molecular chaperone DnaK (HSP70)